VVSLAQVEDPARTVDVIEITRALIPAYIDGPTNWGRAAPGTVSVQQPGKSGRLDQYAQIPTWHGGRVNMLRVDGHLKCLLPPSLMDGNGNGKTDDGYF
jgi:prepilin-type processing-associated H-X9-DG protein